MREILIQTSQNKIQKSQMGVRMSKIGSRIVNVGAQTSFLLKKSVNDFSLGRVVGKGKLRPTHQSTEDWTDQTKWTLS